MKIKSKFFLKFFSWTFFFVLFTVLFLQTEKFSQSWHFVDEDDHLVLGYYMNKGLPLYESLSSIHQPIIYIISSFAQRISRPETLYSLVKTGREAVFIYAFTWSIFLFCRFGTPFLIFSIFFELTKFFVLGNLLLGESLAVYPLVFIIGENFRVLYFKYKPKKIDPFYYGVANFCAVFTLLPLIPSLAIMDLLYWYKTKKGKQILLSFFFMTTLLFIPFSFSDYFKETIINNLKYVIPSISLMTTSQTIWNYFRFPLLAFFKGGVSIFNQLIQFFVFLFIVSFGLAFLNKNKQNKFPLVNLLGLMLAILFLNNRVLVPGEMYYFGSAFHIIPWYAGIIFFCFMTLNLFFERLNKNFKYFVILIVFGGMVYFGSNKQMPYFAKIDKNYEHNINYFHYYLVGEAIKAVSKPNDRIAVFIDESLIYFQSGLNLATRQLIYADWQYQVPQDREEMNKIFTANPPEFLYINPPGVQKSSYFPFLEKVLNNNYYQVTKNGVIEKFYIRKDKIKDISEPQWFNWTKLSFDRINN